MPVGRGDRPHKHSSRIITNIKMKHNIDPMKITMILPEKFDIFPDACFLSSILS